MEDEVKMHIQKLEIMIIDLSQEVHQMREAYLYLYEKYLELLSKHNQVKLDGGVDV